ncbi:rab9 effector protein with kelch motifs isoform X1 [Pelobates fuscus]|uniref:rab9 effector protein with kelch motifs isoform X1 n=1 Tax=Pelobates fuscus TaxID=191477 RepID=UPI002FE43D86
MELMEILEPEDIPKESTWYALVPRGEAPHSRVGHTCMYLPATEESEKGKVLIIAGANPDSCFSDTHILDLDSHEWDGSDWDGLLPRYEHGSFIAHSDPRSIWVFGGAEQSLNRNCVQVFHPGSSAWKSAKVKGEAPSPRTFHTSSSAIGDKLYVFSGGEKGAEPVQDTRLHEYDAASMTWTQPTTFGNPPAPRHGHVTVAVGTKLFIHGGMAGSAFFDDMFCIDTGTMKWEHLKLKGDVPPACAAHSSVALKTYIYIFGGMTELGPVNTMYQFDTESLFWTKMKFESSCPQARLDHSMCLLPWKIRTELSSTEKPHIKPKDNEDTNDHCDKDLECSKLDEVPLCLIFGGMNISGDLYSDCCVTLLQK